MKEAKYWQSSNSWVITTSINNKKTTIHYSERLYGEYAKELCEKAYADGIRYKNYIVEEENYAVMKLYSETNGYFDVLIDKEDIDKIQKHKWGIDIDKRENLNRAVAKNFYIGLLHRYILGLKSDDKLIIDHIDRNPLNNQKSNLRIVDDKLNQQNKNPQKNNKSGIIGVRHNTRENVWTARIADNNSKRHSKSFSVNKYGHEEAKAMAIAWRKAKEKEYGYLT